MQNRWLFRAGSKPSGWKEASLRKVGAGLLCHASSPCSPCLAWAPFPSLPVPDPWAVRWTIRPLWLHCQPPAGYSPMLPGCQQSLRPQVDAHLKLPPQDSLYRWSHFLRHAILIVRYQVDNQACYSYPLGPLTIPCQHHSIHDRNGF